MNQHGSMGLILAGILLLQTATCLLTAPDRPGINPPEFPDCSGECQFGTIKQTGRGIEVDGSAWWANGVIRKDGSVLLHWTNSGGGTGLAVYHLRDGNLVGVWGWAHEVEFGPGGELLGMIRGETLTRRKP